AVTIVVLSQTLTKNARHAPVLSASRSACGAAVISGWIAANDAWPFASSAVSLLARTPGACGPGGWLPFAAPPAGTCAVSEPSGASEGPGALVSGVAAS